MAMGAGGLLGGVGSAFSSIAETGVDAIKFTVEQGGKVVKAVRDDRTEIEIPGWMLGNRKGDPVKIPSQLFGYAALGLGVYVLARILGVRPFDWLVGKMEDSSAGWIRRIPDHVVTPEERAAWQEQQKQATVEAIAASSGASKDDVTRLYLAVQNGVLTNEQAKSLVAKMKAGGKTLDAVIAELLPDMDAEYAAKLKQV